MSYSDGSYEPPSLQPLIITPEIAAAARAANQANHQEPPPLNLAADAAPPSSEQIGLLQGMFPDFDADVLSSVLSMCGGNVEDAVSQLLEMNGGPAASDPAPSSGMDMDEELAAALFQSFAEDLEQSLGTPIPPEIKADPEKFEAFVKRHLETALQDTSNPHHAQANQLFQSSGAGEAFNTRGGKVESAPRTVLLHHGGSGCP